MEKVTICFKQKKGILAEVAGPIFPQSFLIDFWLMDRWVERGVFDGVPSKEVDGWKVFEWEGTGLYEFCHEFPADEIRRLWLALFYDLSSYLSGLYRTVETRRFSASHIQSRWADINKWVQDLEAEQDEADIWGGKTEQETFTASLEGLADVNQTTPDVIERGWLVYYSPHHPKLDRIAEVFEIPKKEVSLQCCIDFFVVGMR